MSKSSSAPNVYNSHRRNPCARVFVSKYISGMCDVGSIFLSILILSVFIIRFLVMQIQISDDICPTNRLNMLKLQNPNKIVIGHLNINSIRNKFEFLKEIVGKNIDILLVSESKIDDTFPIGQFTMQHYHTPFREDRNGKGGGLIHLQSYTI